MFNGIWLDKKLMLFSINKKDYFGICESAVVTCGDEKKKDMSQQDQLNLLSCIFGPKLFDSWAFVSGNLKQAKLKHCSELWSIEEVIFYLPRIYKGLYASLLRLFFLVCSVQYSSHARCIFFLF